MQLVHTGLLSSTAKVSPSTGFLHRYSIETKTKKYIEEQRTINLWESKEVDILIFFSDHNHAPLTQKPKKTITIETRFKTFVQLLIYASIFKLKRHTQ